MIKSVLNKLLILALSCMLPLNVQAQPELIKDVNTSTRRFSSQTYDQIGNYGVFEFSTPEYGRELWSKDLTTGNVAMLGDFSPGVSSSYIYSYTLGEVQGKLIFDAEINGNGALIATDGTPQGTQNILPSDISYVYNLVPAGNVSFFIAEKGSTGTELFITDGTLAGTRLVKDITPGTESTSFNRFTASAGKAVFIVQTDTSKEVWYSDGTEAGTRKIHEITDYISARTIGFFGASNRVIFAYYNYDLEKEFVSVYNGSVWHNLTDGEDVEIKFSPRSNLAYAINRDYTPLRVYKTDGTSAGSANFTSANEVNLEEAVFNASHQLVAPGTVSPKIFLINGSSNAVSEITLQSGTLTSLNDIYYANSTIYVTGSRSQQNPRIFKLVSLKLQEFLPTNVNYNYAARATKDNSSLYFLGYGADYFAGQGLYKTAGTSATTSLVKTLATGSQHYIQFADYDSLGSRFLLHTVSNSNYDDKVLWVSDGTTQGTTELNDIIIPGYTAASVQYDSDQVVSKDKLFYKVIIDGSYTQRVVLTDGTDGGTSILANSIGNAYMQGDLIDISAIKNEPAVGAVAINYSLNKSFIYSITASGMTLTSDITSQTGATYVGSNSSVSNSNGLFMLLNIYENSKCSLYSANMANGNISVLLNEYSDDCASIVQSSDKSKAYLVPDTFSDFLLKVTDGTPSGTQEVNLQGIGASGLYSLRPVGVNKSQCMFTYVYNQNYEEGIARVNADNSVTLIKDFSEDSRTFIQGKEGEVVLTNYVYDETSEDETKILFYSVSCDQTSPRLIGSLRSEYDYSYDSDVNGLYYINRLNNQSILYKITSEGIKELQNFASQEVYLEEAEGTSQGTVLRISEDNGKNAYWTTNGTQEETKFSGYVGNGLANDYNNMIAVGDNVLFAADDYIHGKEYWKLNVNFDLCPSDSSKTKPGMCGCGIPDTDSDLDGKLDCMDLCSADPEKTEPQACGCGISDKDSDTDGKLDCHDSCPQDAAKTEAGACGCGVADVDTDANNVIDCKEKPIKERTPSKPVIKKLVNKKNKKVTYQLTMPDFAKAYQVSAGSNSGKKVKAKLYKTNNAVYTFKKLPKGKNSISYSICNEGYVACSLSSSSVSVNIK